MDTDPVCAQLFTIHPTLDQSVVAGNDGGLANAFVKLNGTFAQTPVPAQPVVLDQRDCFFAPRVMGARVGQVLRILNSDHTFHNVHSMTTRSNAFNIGQPIVGARTDFRLKDEEMLHITCDVHKWMTAYIGVVNHSFFAVTRAEGTFEMLRVPPGTYTIEVWHERLGTISKPVRVRAGEIAVIDLPY